MCLCELSVSALCAVNARSGLVSCLLITLPGCDSVVLCVVNAFTSPGLCLCDQLSAGGSPLSLSVVMVMVCAQPAHHTQSTDPGWHI